VPEKEGKIVNNIAELGLPGAELSEGGFKSLERRS
jgi:hypothetical protein